MSMIWGDVRLIVDVDIQQTVIDQAIEDDNTHYRPENKKQGQSRTFETLDRMLYW